MATTEKSLSIENVKIVMDGLASIGYNTQSWQQNTISLFKTSYNGMFFIKDDPKLFRQAIGMWLEIIETQLLGIIDNDYSSLENKTGDIKWLNTLFLIKKAYQQS